MTDSDVRRTGRWLLMITVLGSLSLGAAITVGRRSMRMSASMAGAADQNALAASAPGSSMKVVMEVTSVGPGAATGNLLDRQRDDLYKRTVKLVNIHYTDATPVVMGKLADLHTGAVVHVKGTVRDDHSIAAEQIVILTGYIQVQ